MREADQMIAEALRDIAAEAGPPGPSAEAGPPWPSAYAAWRGGRRRRLAMLGASALSVAGAIALTLALVLPPTAAPGPGSGPGPGPVSPPTRPSPLVSVTLAPVTPASPEVLTTAAGLIGQRVAALRLANVQIRVSAPDIVLTGPAADETQLKALATAGLLNIRQVLLYQPWGGTAAYGNAGLVNQHTLALFRRLTCTPGRISTWPDQVGYTAAAYDNPDTQIVSCDASGNKYALDAAAVRGTQISKAAAGLSRTANQWVVLLTLKSAGTSAFAALTSHQYSAYFTAGQAGNQNDLWLGAVAFVLDGNVISAPHTDNPILGGYLLITANFTRAQAEDIAAQLQSGPLPVGFRVST